MPGGSRAEIYFITAMMMLILIICAAAVYFFFKTYKKEMKEKEERLAKRPAPADSPKDVASQPTDHG
jgi:flagellar basal body-associated protein FliL